ncbi:MAG: hypothetical protein Q4B90_09370 [Eubacteriales bacterium]|nr:hypothetical protein [Eubacteriales bacterium]
MERKIAEVILYFVYGGLKELSAYDDWIKKEVKNWRPGMTYALKCGSDGPDLYIRKGEYGVEKLDPSIQEAADVCIQFKSFSHAFCILIGRALKKRMRSTMLLYMEMWQIQCHLHGVSI